MATTQPWVSNPPNIMPITQNPASVTSAEAAQRGLISQTTGTGYTPTNRTVDANQTVQGQIGDIVAKNSPLQQLAESRSTQRMNDRGLINSSMAIGAGQSALYDAAMPIAQADAQTYGRAAEMNQVAANQASQFGAQATNTASLANAEAGNRSDEQQASLIQQANLANAAATNQASMFNSEQYLKGKAIEADQYSKQILQSADNSLKEYMANLESNYKTLMQTDASVATIMTQYLRAMSEVQTSPNLDATGKQTAITNLQTAIADSMALQDAISGLDLSSILAG